MTTKKKSSPLAGVLNFIGTAVIIIIIALCLSVTAPKIFGISSYTVITGSMEPSVPVGSVVYAKAIEPSSLEPDDIVVFYDGRSTIPVTHRVVENQTENSEIITKGDANDTNDITPIPYQNVIGKVVLHLPALGHLLALLGTLMGKAAALAFILGGFLLCEVSRRMRQ